MSRCIMGCAGNGSNLFPRISLTLPCRSSPMALHPAPPMATRAPNQLKMVPINRLASLFGHFAASRVRIKHSPSSQLSSFPQQDQQALPALPIGLDHPPHPSTPFI